MIPITSFDISLENLLNGRLPYEIAQDCLSRLTLSSATAQLLDDVVGVLSATVAHDMARLFPSTCPIMDCCGTGGSGITHFNVSTTVAFVLASAGIPVVKFGNRAASSSVGSFDLLEAVGIPPAPDVQLTEGVFASQKLAFLFAPQFYPTLVALGPVRKALGVRTILNLVGPLLNPVKPQYRLLGAPDLHSQEIIASYLSSQRYNKRSFVVRSESGMDEISPNGETYLLDVTPNSIEIHKLHKEHRFSVDVNPKLTIAENVAIFNSILSNSREFDFFRQAVVLNAAAAMLVYGKVDSIEEGESLAESLLASHEVKNTFEQFRGAYDGNA